MSKTVVSCVGDVTIRRRSYHCKWCKASWVPFDAWAGLKPDCLTPWTRRMAALAASSWSFDVASARLLTMCGVRLSDQTIRRSSQASGEAAEGWLSGSEAVLPLREAEGEWECYVDGTIVNTRKGWREMRLSVAAKRPAGEAAKVSEWSDRSLPGTTARLALAGMCDAAAVGARLGELWERLGPADGEGVSVLGDGARWIWKKVDAHLPRSEGTLDIYHLLEHLHACGKALYGDTPRATQWAEAERVALMEQRAGPYLRGLMTRLKRARGAADAGASEARALRELCVYLLPNRHRLDYMARLSRGLAIGSGMVEGACKTVVGRRLKLNSARWNVRGAETIAALCCLDYSGLWDEFWRNPHQWAA